MSSTRRRGVVDIVSRAGLEAMCRECYGVMRSTYDRLFPRAAMARAERD